MTEYERMRRDGLTDDEIALALLNMYKDGGTFKEAALDAAGDGFTARAASAFGEDNTDFVWRPYLPVGDYSVLMADGGTGKTIFCCGIAAAVSRGQRLLGDDRTQDFEPQNVLIISAEDRGELLKKRLDASGADLDRVFLLDCMDSEGMNFTDGYDLFKQTIQRYSPRLVIIDPWHAFLGADTDINRVNAVRPVFQRLANLAKDCSCGMVLVSHVNKKAQIENANNAATGSTDFINAARSAMRVIFDDDPAEKDTRTMIHTKSNYAAAGRSIKYRIDTSGGCQWVGFSDITRQTLENAARWRKTPYEALQIADDREEHSSFLIDAVKDKAVSGKTVNVSYDELRDEYGGDIFGSVQPKKALDAVANALRSDGVKIETGKTVRYSNRTRNGFSIYTADTVGDVLADLPM